MAFSTRFATICVSNSRSPRRRIEGLILALKSLTSVLCGRRKRLSNIGKGSAEIELTKA